MSQDHKEGAAEVMKISSSFLPPRSSEETKRHEEGYVPLETSSPVLCLDEEAPVARRAPLLPTSLDVIDGMNAAQESANNKRSLDAYGGIGAVADRLGVSLTSGLTATEVPLMRAAYGSNVFSDCPREGILSIFIGTFKDTVLQILLAAAIVSLVIGMIQDPKEGYIEGVAIFIAVVLVAVITTFNDYSKELQFRALEAEAAGDERAAVLRDGTVTRIKLADVVVGDILVLQVGDSVAADCIIIGNNAVTSDESGLTGEASVKKKSHAGDPFLLSSCLLTAGDETRALVIAVGPRSQWGKIKTNLAT